MKRKTILSSSSRHIIQPDSRGRVQLPQDMRGFDFYEIKKHKNIHTLRGIKVEQIPQLDEDIELPKRWLPDEVQVFLKQRLFPKTCQFLKEQKLILPVACYLYGSQARNTAHTNSDFDFAILTSEHLSYAQRKSFNGAFEEFLKEERTILDAHKIQGDFSLVYLNTLADNFPPLYFSIADEGTLIYDSSDLAKNFQRRIKEKTKKLKMKKTKIANSYTWSWENI